MLRFQQLVTETWDSCGLQNIIQRRNIFVISRHKNLKHIHFADVTVGTEELKEEEKQWTICVKWIEEDREKLAFIE